MSVTPTESALIVALDFEGPAVSLAMLLCRGLIWLLIGVHSIERSAQEDMLLVLFNTAISNLVRDSCSPRFHVSKVLLKVLFRNNFVLSRDVTGHAFP
jgi:hypothetical protein